jgi:hypothetical protein
VAGTVTSRSLLVTTLDQFQNDQSESFLTNADKLATMRCGCPTASVSEKTLSLVVSQLVERIIFPPSCCSPNILPRGTTKPAAIAGSMEK